MTFVIPSDLAPELYPLAWVVGTWEGHGVLEYPGIETADFRQRVVFDHDGGPYLTYTATITLMGPDGEEGQVWSVESGFWRVAPTAPEGVQLGENQHPLEVVLADASGLLTAFFGAVGNGRIDLASRFAAATESGPDVRAATRMYGNVGGELMWAWDLKAFGQELRSYASGRLSRVEGPEVPEDADTIAPDPES
ncbi:FABP family protein [Demequina rhizosphaerae]|uniref:FABP family protein n=1 Tax=Demequina rhizosphaerae TaxID=1638985 RepID=UPI00078568DB|nr:FABP family protein [Demequina rhizosphaerae]